MTVNPRTPVLIGYGQVNHRDEIDPATLEISVDTKAKINEGDYCRGGKVPDGFPGPDAQGPRP